MSAVGTWCEVNESTNTCDGYMAYSTDNTYYAYGVIYEYGFKYISEGSWSHDDGKACIVPEKRIFIDLATGQEFDPEIPLSRYCDEIILINNKHYIYLDHNDESEVKMPKVSDIPNKSLQLSAKAPAE